MTRSPSTVVSDLEDLIWEQHFAYMRNHYKDIPEKRYAYLTPIELTWGMKIQLWKRRLERKFKPKQKVNLKENGPYR